MEKTQCLMQTASGFAQSQQMATAAEGILLLPPWGPFPPAAPLQGVARLACAGRQTGPRRLAAQQLPPPALLPWQQQLAQRCGQLLPPAGARRALQPLVEDGFVSCHHLRPGPARSRSRR